MMLCDFASDSGRTAKLFGSDNDMDDDDDDLFAIMSKSSKKAKSVSTLHSHSSSRILIHLSAVSCVKLHTMSTFSGIAR